MGEFALGQPVPRFEDPRLIRGGGRYVDDLSLPRMVYGCVLRSPHAHARIRGIDTNAAQAAPGVLLVLTGADWAASGWNDLPTPGGLKRLGGQPSAKIRFPALTSDKVRWVGDYVAFVVAETLAQAMDAAELIEVDYEPLPAVVSTAGALDPGAPLVWDDRPDNVSFVHPEGNRAATEEALAKADRIVKRKFTINRVTAARWSRAVRSPITTRPRTVTRSTRCCSARTATVPNSPRSCRCRKAKSVSSPAISAAASE
jgi:carbon-monoxide dehydrogenase large subunit